MVAKIHVSGFMHQGELVIASLESNVAILNVNDKENVILVMADHSEMTTEENNMTEQCVDAEIWFDQYGGNERN